MTVELEGQDFFRYLEELRLKVLAEQKKLDSHQGEKTIVIAVFSYSGPRLSRDFLEEVNTPHLPDLPSSKAFSFLVDRSTLYSDLEVNDSGENPKIVENS